MKKTMLLQELKSDEATLYDYKNKEEIVISISIDQYEVIAEMVLESKEYNFEAEESMCLVVFNTETKQIDFTNDEIEVF